jgi:hypothetical protein
MEKEFIPYEQALALKELGFDEPCFGLYHYDTTFYPTQCKSHEQFYGQICLAPLYQQAFRWFREKYNLFGQVNIHTYFIYNISNDGFEMIKQYDKLTNTYEEAELACLIKLIEIVKSK